MSEDSKNWLNPKLKIEDSPIHGKGMFATSPIAENEIVIIWRQCYTDRQGAEEKRKEEKGVMQWDEDIFSFEHPENEDHYVINHSCDPNTWMTDAFTIVSRRRILSGEEITIDYAQFLHEEGNGSPMKCSCGSGMCRSRITRNDWKDRELQDRYRGHFSPLVNKMIEESMKGDD